MITIKKIPIVTKKEIYEDLESGQVVESQESIKVEKDYGFSKVWINDTYKIIEPLSKEGILLWFWILKNVNPKNLLTKSFIQISKEMGIERRAIGRNMKLLISKNAIKEIKKGLYMVNPDIYFKGNHYNRVIALEEYSKVQNHKTKEQ